MLFLSLIGFILVVWIRSMPPVQRDQRFLADLLAQAVQKYRMDNGEFPKDLPEAAIHYRSENPQLFDRVTKAEKDWGMTGKVEGTTTETPELFIKFEKPAPLEKRFALLNKDKKAR